MSTVEAEAAAALFGASDSQSDPFSAVLGDDGGPESTPAAGTESTLANEDPSSLFETGEASSGVNTYGYDSWLSPTDGYQDGSVNEAGAGYSGDVQGWYDQNGQCTTYDQPQASEGYTDVNGGYNMTTQTTSSASHPYAPNAFSATSSYEPRPEISQAPPHYTTPSYDPYAPQSASSPYAPQSTPSTYAPQSTPSTYVSGSTPSAYAPQSTPSPYAPSNSAYTTFQPRYEPSTSYDSYKPPAFASSYGAGQPPAQKAPPPVSAPPPPAPKADTYRPKVVNAYDPPLPPAKPKYRNALPKSPSLSAFSAYGIHSAAPPSPAYAQAAHAVSPPPPPPPRAASAGISRPPHAVSSPDSSRASSPPVSRPVQPGHSQAVYGNNGVRAKHDGFPRSSSPSVSTYQAQAYGYGSSGSNNTFDSAPLTPSLTATVDVVNMYGGGVSLQSPPSSGPKTAPAILEDDPENPMTSFQDTFETGRTYQPRQEGVAAQTSLESSSDSSVLTTDAAESGSGRVSSPDRMPAESSSNPEEDNQNSKGAPVLPSPPPRSSYSYEPQPSSSRSSLDKHMPAESPARSPPPPSINRSSLDRYAPAKSATVSPPPAAINGYAVPVYDPYKPSQRDNDPPQQSAQRAKSPGATSVRSYTSSLGGQSASSVASRSQSPTVHLPARDRAMSNGIPFGPAQPPANANPYTPVYGIKRESSEVSDYGDSWTSRSYPSVEAGHIPITTASEPDRGQDIYLSAPARAPYAPSPTLLGANDPLGRVAARAPLMSFGFGGKLLTCFHGSSSLSTGFDVALSSRPSTDIQMRTLHTLLPESASGVAVPAYPGPLFSDPGTPTTTSLVRTNASQVKAKKARVLKYLEEKEEEISRAVGYLTRGSSEHRRAEGKLVLVKLLKIMVENDGKLSGSDSVDAAARSALVPRIQATSNSNETGLSAAADLSLGYPGLGSSQPNETPLASYIVKPSTLDKIQDFLLRGERRKACHYALDEKLWAHAMLIASSIDKEAWKEVVHEFLRTELGYQSAGGHGASLGANGKAADPGRTSLRVAYSLFAGEGASSVQEMVPPKLLSKTTSESLQVPHPVTPMAPTPISPNFPSAALTTSVPEDVLADWPETAAMLLSNPMTADASSALTTLGDYLAANHWVEAAHACYLLSPQTSAIGGAGSPSVRLVLVGSPSPQNFTRFGKDHDPIIFSEIAEFALSLAPTTKGQETFAGLPHLQAYRLIRAATLAELGHVQLANRYCEAIRSSLSRQSPYFNVVFMHCLRELSDRLVAAPQVDKAGSWIGGKMSKPSLDSIGSWVGGRLTKFIAGDEDKSPTDDPLGRSSQDDNTFSGPFTHYSAISSTVPSHTPSPAPSVQSLNFASASPPPRRSGSAMALRPNLTSDVHVDRASSAMDYTRPSARKSSPAPRLGSSDTSSSSPYGQVPSFGQVVNGYGAANGYGGYPSSPMAPSADGSEASQNGSSWWNGYGAENDSVTPTASSFNHTNDAEGGADSSNFISLMDDQMMTPMASQTSAAPSRGISYDDEDIEDDLGIGNPTKKSKADKAETKEPGKPSPTETSNNKPDTDKPALSSTSSSSWLSRLWKRESTPTPVKANLGEEVTFYYDKELKRWVNKKAGADAAQPKPPPPPPSRAQTASPSRSAPGVTPPPARPASAVDLTISPPKKPPMRVRSNLVPEGVESAPTTPAAHAGLDVPPPPGRPKSGMAKRSARSRYVDVFQSQPGS